MADAMTLVGNADHVRARIDDYFQAGATSVVLNPSAPSTFYPLYEGHFPADTEFLEFDFPGYLGVIEGTISAIGATA